MFRPPSSNLRCKQKCAESIRIGLMCLRTNWDWLMIFFIHQIRDRRCSQLSYKTNKLEATRTDQQTWSHNQIWRHCISFAYKISWSLQISYATWSIWTFAREPYFATSGGICPHSILVSGKFWWINLEYFRNQMIGLERFRTLLFASEVQARRPEHSYPSRQYSNLP